MVSMSYSFVSLNLSVHQYFFYKKLINITFNRISQANNHRGENAEVRRAAPAPATVLEN